MKNKTPYNQFRAMAAVCVASFRSTLRSPSSIAFGIVFPLVFIVVFGSFGSGGATMAVGFSPSGDPDFMALTARLDSSPVVKMVLYLDTMQMQDDLLLGKVDLVVKPIPGGVDVTSSSTQSGNARLFRLIVQSIAYRHQQHVPEFEVREHTVKARVYRNIDFLLPGQLGFSLLSVGVFATAFVFLGLRQTLVLKRFYATPIKRLYIVLGEGMARLFFALMNALIIIAIGYLVFGFTLVEGMFTVMALLLLSALGLIVFMGFGFIISGVSRSEATVAPLANVVTLPQFLLSGTFFPMALLPEWLQAIGQVLPLTHLNQAMRIVSFEGVADGRILLHIGVLVVWGIVLYAVSGRVFRWE